MCSKCFGQKILQLYLVYGWNDRCYQPLFSFALCISVSLCTGLVPNKVVKVSVKAIKNSIVLLSFHKMTVIRKKKILGNWILQFVSFQISMRLAHNYRKNYTADLMFERFKSWNFNCIVSNTKFTYALLPLSVYLFLVQFNYTDIKNCNAKK
jgi:hypothetical protein